MIGDLQTALLILGAVIIGMVYVISRRQRPTYPRRAMREATAPRLDGYEILGHHRDHPTPAPPNLAHPLMTAASYGDPSPDEPPPTDHWDGDAPTEDPMDDPPAAFSREDPPPEQASAPRAPPDHATPTTRRAPSLANPSGFRDVDIEGFRRLGQIDYWVRLPGERDVGRDTVLGMYRDGVQELSRAHAIYGLKTPHREWCHLEHESEDSRYTDLVATIQLADCDGPIDEQELSRFFNLIMRLSEGTGRGFSPMAPMENALAQGAALAAFIEHFSPPYMVHVRTATGDPFSGEAIDHFAAAVGLERDRNGYSRFKPMGRQRVILYSLVNMPGNGDFDFADADTLTTAAVTFFTRPAINRSPGAAFAEMVHTALAFAARIGGTVDAPGCDDLSEDAIAAARTAIDDLAADMTQLGIAPGSEESIRLFDK